MAFPAYFSENSSALDGSLASRIVTLLVFVAELIQAVLTILSPDQKPRVPLRTLTGFESSIANPVSKHLIDLLS